MKKIVLCLMFFCFIMVIPLFTQEAQQMPVSVTQAIDESVKTLTARIKTGAMIVVFGIQTPTTELTTYVTDGIIDHLVSKDEMKIVDRQNADLIAMENEIQMSGNVDDEYIQGIGHQLGAEIIITGSMTLEGEMYQLRLQALNVRTAQVLVRTSRNVSMNTVLASLLGIKWKDPNGWKQKRWYLGLRGGGDLNIYSLGKDTDGFFDKLDTPFGFHGVFETGIQFTKFFSLQVELMYSRDKVEMKGNGDRYYSFINNKKELKHIDDFFTTIPGYSNVYFSSPSLTLTTETLSIPVLAKFTSRPSIFELSGLAGVYFTIPLGNIKSDFSGGYIIDNAGGFTHYGIHSMNTELEWAFPPIGLMAGANFGIKLGPGVLFTDVRFMMDLMPVKNKEGSGQITPDQADFDYFTSVKISSKELYTRKKIMFDLGYRIGIGNRRN